MSTADTVAKIVNVAIVDAGLTAAKIALRAEMPLLNLPIVSQVFDWLAGRLAQSFADSLSKEVALELISIQNEAEKKAYDLALEALKNAKPEELAHATEEFRNRLRDLVRFRK